MKLENDNKLRILIAKQARPKIISDGDGHIQCVTDFEQPELWMIGFEKSDDGIHYLFENLAADTESGLPEFHLTEESIREIRDFLCKILED